jgi:pyridoxal biosynthesis lyase PdxS
VTCWEDPKRLAEISTGLGPAMPSVVSSTLDENQRFAARGW